jgi:4-alpha-glucanotransferase
VKLRRSCGILLHPTSLPEGQLGESAYRFVDWLHAAGQSWWQVLPLNPPDTFRSPYASTSAFAAWPGLLADADAPVTGREASAFRRRHAYWIDDWEGFAGPGAIEDQVRFEREWAALRAYGRTRGVQLIGDVPIYVAAGSCDHVAKPDLFRRGVVAGAPPDDLAPDGQRWGNPLFDWEALAADGYRWWIERLRRVLSLVDMTRIDHFRGFAAYWTIPAEAESALDGGWTSGPGEAVFRAVQAELGELPVIAEDLGVITPDVEQLRDALEFPGMVVLLWAFQDPQDNPHRLENHREHAVVYTSTHDTTTLAGAFPEREPWELLQLALSSRAALAVLPAQDVLGLGDEARMNRPGETDARNWTWRLADDQLTDELAARLRAEAERANRLPGRKGV